LLAEGVGVRLVPDEVEGDEVFHHPPLAPGPPEVMDMHAPGADLAKLKGWGPAQEYAPIYYS